MTAIWHDIETGTAFENPYRVIDRLSGDLSLDEWSFGVGDVSPEEDPDQ